MSQIAFQSGPVTIYAQLASVMRDRILSGLWKPGDQIPTLDQLVEEYSVARVTVRQAVQMLADDGLVSSQRGRRTFVTYEPQSGNANPLFSSTGSLDKDTANYSITIISKQAYDELPPQLTDMGTAGGKYMRIRKTDNESGIPYVVSDNYVSLPLYRRFPVNADGKIKLSRLAMDYSKPTINSGRERITVGAVNYEEAIHLQVPIGSPAARVTRVLLAPDGTIAYLALLIYRADRFAVERDVTSLLIGKDATGQPARSKRRA